MLDKRSKALLRFINEECREGTYKVIEVDDILRCMPKKYKMDQDGIAQIINYLSNLDYISVKYKDGIVYCVSPLPRGRKIFEIEEDEKRTNKLKKIRLCLLVLLIGIVAFGGMLLASYISKKFL